MIIPLLILALTGYYIYNFYRKTKQLPPGPSPLPLVGNFHQLAFGIVTKRGVIPVMQQWRERYGPVFTMWIGGMAVVNIADYSIATDAMVKNGANFANRVLFFLVGLVRNGKGIIASNGPVWQEQRRFSLHTLRNFGLGRNLMQDRIMLEFDSRKVLMDQELEEAGGQKSVDLLHFIERTIGNIINRMMFSEPFGEDKEDKFFKIKQRIDEMMENLTIFDMMMDEWNCTKWPMKAKHDNMCRLLNMQLDFFKDQIRLRQADIESGEHVIRDEPEDFVDAFLMEMQKSDHGESFNFESLAVTVLDLWAAGQETTTTTLHWAFVFLAMNPEVVKKLQKELDEVTGRNRTLELGDKPWTPYLNATLTEFLRLATLGPLNFNRETAEDTMIGGFLIPKGTAVTAQISLLLHDPKRFEDHSKFNPDRFMNNNDDQFVPVFGMGKRACLGESLARAEMYLIIGNFALAYDFASDPECPATMAAINESGSIRRPKPYKLVLSKRH